MTIKFDAILNEIREADSSSGGSGNVNSSNPLPDGNIVLGAGTTTVKDSGSKLVNTTTVITVGSTETPTFLDALTLASSIITADTLTSTNLPILTIQLPSGLTTVPYRAGGYVIKSPNISLLGQNKSTQIGNVSVAGSLGSAVLTFAAALPTQAVVDGAIQFVTGGTSFTSEGLTGAFRITNISGLVVTIDTPGITLPNDAGSSTKKVIFVPSTILFQTGVASNYSALSCQRQYIPLVSLNFTTDANGKSGINNTLVQYTSRAGGNLASCNFINSYKGLSVTNESNITETSCSFTTCTVGMEASNSSFISEGSSVAGNATQYCGNTTNINCLTNSEIYSQYSFMHLTAVTNSSASLMGSVLIQNDSGITSNGNYIQVSGGEVIGSVKNKIVTADYSATIIDETIKVDATLGNVIVTLPTKFIALYKKLNIKKIDSSVNTVTIQGNGTETIDGSNTMVIPSQYQSISVEADATEWSII